MRRMPWWGLAAAMLFVSACSGSDSSPTMTGSPTSPSSPTAPNAPTSGNTAGATINGMIAPSSSSSTSGVAGVSDVSGVATVTIVGTNVSSAIDAFGRFSLRDAPAGSVQLRFTGSRADATTGVNGLVSGQAVTIVVTVSGSQAVVVSDSRSPNAEIPINGTINGLTGSAAAFEFTIEGRMIRGDAATQFFGDGNRSESFTNMLNGSRVEAKTQARDGFFYAVRLHINPSTSTPGPTVPAPQPNPQPNPRPAPPGEFAIDGPMGGLKGSCPNLSFKVHGHAIASNGSTAFPNAACGSFKNGDKVRVRGIRQADESVVAASIEKQ
jgi:hypothetical protein